MSAFSQVEGAVRKGRLAIALSVIAAGLGLSPVAHALTSPKRPTQAVAVEGQVAPGTGKRFDGIPLDGNGGFDEPMVNDHGNVAFIASYGGTVGAGVFVWARGKNGGKLHPIALTDQWTDVGRFGATIGDFDGPAINTRNVIGFAARNMTGGPSHSAMFVARPNKPLLVLAKEGDWVPGGGKFFEFDDFALNDRSDVSFIASYDGGSKSGVFLRRHDSKDIEKIVRFGDVLPSTGGGRLCGLDGPWMNDDNVVLFMADCIKGGTGGFEGSVFLKRRGQPLEAFARIGDRAPEGGRITQIVMGRPSVNRDEAVMTLDVSGGSTTKMIVTKELVGNDVPDICAKHGDPAPAPLRGELILGNSAPTIAADGTCAFAGEAEAENSAFDVEAIFTCHDGNPTVVAFQGDRMPVGGGTFGSLEEQSNADRFVTFLNESNTPTGVFLGRAPVPVD